MSKTFTYLGSDWDVGDAVCQGFRESLLQAGFESSDNGRISFCWGQRRRRDPDTIIFDIGYIDRAWDSFKNSGKYYQASIGKIGWLPLSAPPDRGDALNVTLGDESHRGGPTVVCGQVAQDAQHGLSAVELSAELEKLMREHHIEGEVYWRPHPQADVSVVPAGLKIYHGDKSDVMHNVRSVVTYNSNIGLEALLAGRQVYCHRDALYYPEALLWRKGVDRRKALLDRIAYAQWTETEIASGACLDHLLKHL